MYIRFVKIKSRKISPTHYSTATETKNFLLFTVIVLLLIYIREFIKHLPELLTVC